MRIVRKTRHYQGHCYFKLNNLRLIPFRVNKKMENRSQLNSGTFPGQTSLQGVVLQNVLRSGEVQTSISKGLFSLLKKNRINFDFKNKDIPEGT